MSVEYRNFTEQSDPAPDYDTTPRRSISAGRSRSVSRGRTRVSAGKGIIPASSLSRVITPSKSSNDITFLDDLDIAQRERCWSMLLEDSEAHFQLDTDGSVLATVHFNADEWASRPHQPASLPSKGSKFGAERSSAKATPRSSTSQTTLRPLPWLLRLINEIYDARFVSYTYEAPDADNVGDFEPLSTFAYSHVTKKFGLEAIVSTACQDLIRAVAAYRKDNLEVETFALFLANQFDAVDLMFYLFARSKLFTALSDDTQAILRRPQYIPVDKCAPCARLILARQPSELQQVFAYILGDQFEQVKAKSGRKVLRQFDVHRYLFVMLETYRVYNNKDPSPYGKSISPIFTAAAGLRTQQGGQSPSMVALASSMSNASTPYQPPSHASHQTENDILPPDMSQLRLGDIDASNVTASSIQLRLGDIDASNVTASSIEPDVESFATLQSKLKRLEETRKRAQAGVFTS